MKKTMLCVFAAVMCVVFAASCGGGEKTDSAKASSKAEPSPVASKPAASPAASTLPPEVIIHKNESSAIGVMRTICSAQAAFQAAAQVDTNGDGIGDYGTLEQLASPPKGEAFIVGDLGSGKKDGYVFTVTVTSDPATKAPGFTCMAKPETPGTTGVRAFFVDQTGVIRFNANGSTIDASASVVTSDH